jgi:hypothetical protein
VDCQPEQQKHCLKKIPSGAYQSESSSITTVKTQNSQDEPRAGKMVQYLMKTTVSSFCIKRCPIQELTKLVSSKSAQNLRSTGTIFLQLHLTRQGQDYCIPIYPTHLQRQHKELCNIFGLLKGGGGVVEVLVNI